MKSECKRPNATSPSSDDSLAVADHRSLGAASSLHLAASERSAPLPSPDRMENLAYGLLEEVGENPGREGLVKTPLRVAKSLRFLTSGYDADLEEIVNGAVFDAEGYDEMVVIREVEFYSLCEHHMLPFFGKVSVAYLPGEKIIGLSKIPRLVDVFARRLQVQERMTQQIAKALEEILEPRGVAVSATGFHLCMAMRGVEKQMSHTTSNAFTGEFRRNPDLKREFLDAVRDR